MQLTLNAKIVGVGAGFLVGVLFVLAGWRIFLILLGFTLLGGLVGVAFDERGAITRRLREGFTRLLGP